MSENTPIRVQGLSYGSHARMILEDISFSVASGSFTVIVGENGAGKSTLLRLLMGLAVPSAGKVFVRGEQPHRDPARARQKIGFLTERITPPIDWFVDEYLAFNREFYESYSFETEGKLLKELRLSPDARLGNLSTGEIRRVQVVGAPAVRPELLFIDEITAVLDIVGRAKFMGALRELQKTSSTTILMATNIIDDVDTYATDVVLLHRGRLALHDPKSKLISETRGATLTAVLAALIERAEVGTP